MLRLGSGLGICLVILTLHATTAFGGTADDPGAMVARMAMLGSCYSPSFSPEGRRIAFVSHLCGLPQVWAVAAEGGWPEPETALDDPVGFDSWSPTGDHLAFSPAPGGMNAQVYSVRSDGSDLRRLTDGGKATNSSGATVHEWRATHVQVRMEPRRYFSGTSVDHTERAKRFRSRIHRPAKPSQAKVR